MAPTADGSSSSADQLLISCLDPEFGVAGGLFVHDGHEVRCIDRLPTSGLAHNGKRLARCLHSTGPTSGLLLYDANGLERYVRLDGVRDPHGIHWSGDDVCVAATFQNRLVWFDAHGREVRRWEAPGAEDSWHLNDLVERDGRLMVCAFGRYREPSEWRRP